MKIKINDIDCFKRLNDLIPTIDINIEKLFSKEYIVDSDSNYVLSNGDKIGTYFSKVEALYELLSNITYNRVQETFIDYYAKSSLKTLSNLIHLLLETYGVQKIDNYYTISKMGIVNILNVIYSRYYRKWEKLYNTFLLEYDPIRPYDMIIHEHKEDTLTSGNTTSSSVSSTDNSTENGSSEDFEFGYDKPEDEVPTKKNSNSYSTGDIYSSNRNDNSNYSRQNPIDTDISKNGNIGNLTQQELIEKERSIAEYQILDIIYKDLDETLTRAKYI